MHVIRLFAKLIRAARQTLRRLVLRFSVDRPAGLPVTGAIRYGLSRWDGLTRFLDDGRIEMDTNSVERAMRPIALNRKIACLPVTTKVRSTGHVLHR